MAAPPRHSGGREEEEAAAAAAESLPCAARAPLPAPPARPPRPDPRVRLTPERQGGAPAGGILRRCGPGRTRRRQVRFRLDSGEEEGGGPELPGQAAESLAGVLAREDWRPEPPRGLGAPVLHSSAALGAEVRAAREQAFDARQAARQRLRSSFVARCAAEARVGEGMNIPREQQLYQGLVSLQVPAEELVSSAVREKLALTGPRLPEARKEAACKGPDLLAFYDPEELFTETAFLDVEGLPPLEPKPRTRDAAATFVMYRKLRQWDS
ncbi:protein phosphatase 1 regulatory subunit 35 [Eublepharis macularius]|uniref:Protein phosphatase 1 regulatory subunit 35 n=1 Tax=Eublepharis macularius TaxID=481883 RepID=A0AA97LDC0_EUBMA|nr:protein phosphatase 1 regulatory subunit 35 [Eublepharis macularius]